MSAAARSWTSRLALAARLLLGAWFLFTGAAKTFDPMGFAAVIEEYGILTDALATRAAAWGIIAAEVAAGACLLLGVGRRVSLAAVGAMLVVFTAATGRAWAAGHVHDCGCFGPLLERTPGQTLVQDLILVGVLGAALLEPRAVSARPAGWRARLALGVSLTGLIAPPAVARFAPPLRDGATLQALGLDAHLPWDPAGEIVFGFLEPLGSRRDLQRLNALVRAGTPVVALTTASVEQIEIFRWTAGPSFEIVSVPRKLLRRLSGDRSGAFRARHGRVEGVWLGRVPEPSAILAAAEAPARARQAQPGAP